MILDVCDRFQESDCSIAVQTIACISDFEQTLQIRRKFDAISHQKDEPASVQRNGGTNLNKYVWVQYKLFFPF